MDFDNRKVYGDTSITDGLVSFNYRVPRHLGGHVGVDADGWEHGEVEQEVPACEENQGGREGPGHKQVLY